MKRYLTYEDAVSLLPNSDYVHTFYNMAFGLCGADWNKTEILEKLKASEIIELTGETARSMGHGMCAYNKDKNLSEVLFIETDNEKLLAFDKGE